MKHVELLMTRHPELIDSKDDIEKAINVIVKKLSRWWQGFALW